MSRNLIDELEIEKNHADSMAAATEFWMQKTREAQRTIAALVEAAGGRIEVGHEILGRLTDIEMITWHDPASYKTIFLTRTLTRRKTTTRHHADANHVGIPTLDNVGKID